MHRRFCCHSLENGKAGDMKRTLWSLSELWTSLKGFVLFWSLRAVGTEDVTIDGMNLCHLLLGPMVTLLHSAVILSPSFRRSRVVTRRPWFRCIELKKKSCHNPFLYQCHLVHHMCCRPFFLSFFMCFEFYSVRVTCADCLVSHVLSLTGLWQISLDVVVFGYTTQGVNCGMLGCFHPRNQMAEYHFQLSMFLSLCLIWWPDKYWRPSSQWKRMYFTCMCVTYKVLGILRSSPNLFINLLRRLDPCVRTCAHRERHGYLLRGDAFEGKWDSAFNASFSYCILTMQTTFDPRMCEVSTPTVCEQFCWLLLASVPFPLRGDSAEPTESLVPPRQPLLQSQVNFLE